VTLEGTVALTSWAVLKARIADGGQAIGQRHGGQEVQSVNVLSRSSFTVEGMETLARPPHDMKQLAPNVAIPSGMVMLVKEPFLAKAKSWTRLRRRNRVRAVVLAPGRRSNQNRSG